MPIICESYASWLNAISKRGQIQMMTLLVTMKASVEQASAQGQTQLTRNQLTQFEQQYRALIETGLSLKSLQSIPCQFMGSSETKILGSNK